MMNAAVVTYFDIGAGIGALQRGGGGGGRTTPEVHSLWLAGREGCHHRLHAQVRYTQSIGEYNYLHYKGRVSHRWTFM